MGGKSNQQMGSEAGGIAGGIVGSVFPVVGTALGGMAGSALGGAIGSEFGGSGSGNVSGGGKKGGGGGTGASNAYAGNLTNLAGQIQGLAGNYPNLATQAYGTGMNAGVFGENLLNQGLNQYTAGAAGQLTPAQQALTNFNLGQMNAGTNATYGNLGLGGSTMQGQDLNANSLQSLAQQEAIDFQNQTAGLNAMGMGNNLLGTQLAGLTDAGGLYSQEANVLGGAGSLYNAAAGNVLTQNQMFNQALSGGGLGGLSSLIGGTGAGGSGGTGLSGLISQLTGSGGSAGGKSAAPGEVASSTVYDAAGNVVSGKG